MPKRRFSCLLPSYLLGAAAVLALGCGQAAAAEAVVVASSAPGYVQGQLVADGQAVRLPDGANATLLFANGRLLRLRGPYDGVPGEMADGAVSARAGPADDRFMQSDLGAARALGNPLDAALEKTLAVDPSVSGTQCVKAGGTPLLRRPAEPGLDRLMLQAGAERVPVSWTDAGPIPWPRGLPLVDGADIGALRPDGTPVGTLHLRMMEATGGAALAVGMASAGCAGQIGAAMASLRDAAVPLDLFLSADPATDSGAGPAYRPGEDIRLLVQTDRDANLYCYLRNARAQLIPIFPPGATMSARVMGNVPISLSGDRMPLRAADGPADLEVRCIATSRNLDNEMPGRAAAFRPLPEEAAVQLDRAVSRLRETEVASAQLILKVR
ncbi:hypothetical protein J2848_003578 [Azospirillum lipoferum]|uniref:DUF4384 domain-containing protein n=1 Tax=Azospirillum lipoferum TaxID=193 RepID=A0A5A9GLL7_AZOLI|nr:MULTISPECIES: DUF4384 domain-containing protein [Azospirillum]KAA0595227.1 DUF4384 domain-containing protein [Azospirillum lipoferum]MCP1611900.1 hypothetical protein [Azospirillum lipoferum]MDW5533341.1 DUF4384 domain-containing protein [Azospirillum sp. NL1]